MEISFSASEEKETNYALITQNSQNDTYYYTHTFTHALMHMHANTCTHIHSYKEINSLKASLSVGFRRKELF